MKTLKAKKILLIAVLFSIGLVGCAGQIEGNEVNLAVKYCEARGGVDYLGNTVVYGVRCNNGEWKRYIDLRTAD